MWLAVDLPPAVQYIGAMTNAYERWDADAKLRWRSYITDVLGAVEGQEAARRMDVSASTITNWTRHGTRPSLEFLERFAEAFERPLEEVRMYAGLTTAPASTAMIDEISQRVTDQVTQRVTDQVVDRLLQELGDEGRPLLLAIKERRRAARSEPHLAKPSV